MPIMDDIRNALEVHLSGTSGIPSLIGYENARVSKDATDEQIQTHLIPTSRRPAVRGPNPQMRYQGLYEMTVCVPVNTGSGTALGYVDTLLSRFDGSTDIAGSSVTVSIEYAEVGDPYDRDPFYCIPVQVAWYVYST